MEIIFAFVTAMIFAIIIRRYVSFSETMFRFCPPRWVRIASFSGDSNDQFALLYVILYFLSIAFIPLLAALELNHASEGIRMAYNIYVGVVVIGMIISIVDRLIFKYYKSKRS